jgi:hypothetical protein
VGERLTQMAADVEAKAGVRPQRFLVQEMVSGGTELILGMHRDPLGTAILAGHGRRHGRAVQGHDDAAAARGRGGLSGLSRERRTRHGEGPQDLAAARRLPRPAQGRCRIALVDAIVAFSQMAAQLGERLVEAEINPLFVLPQGTGRARGRRRRRAGLKCEP